MAAPGSAPRLSEKIDAALAMTSNIGTGAHLTVTVNWEGKDYRMDFRNLKTGPGQAAKNEATIFMKNTLEKMIELAEVVKLGQERASKPVNASATSKLTTALKLTADGKIEQNTIRFQPGNQNARVTGDDYGARGEKTKVYTVGPTTAPEERDVSEPNFVTEGDATKQTKRLKIQALVTAVNRISLVARGIEVPLVPAGDHPPLGQEPSSKESEDFPLPSSSSTSSRSQSSSSSSSSSRRDVDKAEDMTSEDELQLLQNDYQQAYEAKKSELVQKKRSEKGGEALTKKERQQIEEDPAFKEITQYYKDLIERRRKYAKKDEDDSAKNVTAELTVGQRTTGGFSSWEKGKSKDSSSD